MLPKKAIMQDTVGFVYFQMATTTAKSTHCRDGVIFVCSILRGMSTVIDCIVFIIACFPHLESVSKCIFHISFFLSADSLSSAILVGLSKEGRRIIFKVFERDGRIEGLRVL